MFFKVLMFFVIVAVIFCIGPMIFLWALNTLFEQGSIPAYIPHNFWTYLATFCLGGAGSGVAAALK